MNTQNEIQSQSFNFYNNQAFGLLNLLNGLNRSLLPIDNKSFQVATSPSKLSNFAAGNRIYNTTQIHSQSKPSESPIENTGQDLNGFQEKGFIKSVKDLNDLSKFKINEEEIQANSLVPVKEDELDNAYNSMINSIKYPGSNEISNFEQNFNELNKEFDSGDEFDYGWYIIIGVLMLISLISIAISIYWAYKCLNQNKAPSESDPLENVVVERPDEIDREQLNTINDQNTEELEDIKSKEMSENAEQSGEDNNEDNKISSNESINNNELMPKVVLNPNLDTTKSSICLSMNSSDCNLPSPTCSSCSVLNNKISNKCDDKKALANNRMKVALTKSKVPELKATYQRYCKTNGLHKFNK